MFSVVGVNLSGSEGVRVEEQAKGISLVVAKALFGGSWAS